MSGRLIGDTLIVRAPPEMPDDKLQEIIENFKKRLERRKLKRELNKKENLREICQKLNQEYFWGQIDVKSIGYSTNQTTKWGVCNYKNKTILISHRLSQMPTWVRDYVIVHEMVHLLHPNHSKRFWKKVRRYRLSERARGYLIAKGGDDADESDIERENMR